MRVTEVAKKVISQISSGDQFNEVLEENGLDVHDCTFFCNFGIWPHFVRARIMLFGLFLCFSGCDGHISQILSYDEMSAAKHKKVAFNASIRVVARIQALFFFGL